MKANAKELFKVIGASVMTVAVASGLLMGVNALAYAAVTQSSEIIMNELPAVAQIEEVAQVAEATVNAGQEAFQEPELNVSFYPISDHEDFQPKVGAMGYEEAAQIGARYIWEIYGDSIDGKFVDMTYTAFPYESRTFWFGSVTNYVVDDEPVIITSVEENIRAVEEAEAENNSNPRLYGFMIDAVTGEWIQISQSREARTTEGWGASIAMPYDEYGDMMRNPQPPENIDEYKAAAMEFAQKNFTHSKVVSAEFESVYYEPDRLSNSKMGLQFGEKIEKTYIFEKGASVSILVTDDTGCVARVGVGKETIEATSFGIRENFRIPGFNREGTIYDGE